MHLGALFKSVSLSQLIDEISVQIEIPQIQIYPLRIAHRPMDGQCAR